MQINELQKNPVGKKVVIVGETEVDNQQKFEIGRNFSHSPVTKL